MDGQARGRDPSRLLHAEATASGRASRIATVSVALVLLAGPGCAGSQAPWDVAARDQARFEETTRICRLLTDDRAGEMVAERFETCMERRGWKRQCFLKRLFSRD